MKKSEVIKELIEKDIVVTEKILNYATHKQKKIEKLIDMIKKTLEEM